MSGFQGSVSVVIAPSRVLRRASWLAHGCAMLALIACYVATPARHALCALVLLHGAAVDWRGRRPRRPAPARLELDARDRLWLDCGDGRLQRARLCAPPLLSAHAIALSLQCDDRRRHHLLLLSDSADRDALRRLRVRLRYVEIR